MKEITALDAVAAIEAGTLTSERLVRGCLDRIAERDGVVKAWAHLDPDQAIAKDFRAACTPDLFLFDAAHRLVYRGQLDDSRPGNNLPLDGHDLRAAITALLAGQPVPLEQKPSIGCNIKWHPGQEPPWFG